MEDYNIHWGFASFKYKIIIDFGADFGSTVEYFLIKGASKVIAVEGNPTLSSKLLIDFFNNPKVICIEQFINTPEHFREIISQYPADIIKVDIEGYEKHLLHIPINIFLSVNEYLIETHTSELLNGFLGLFHKLGYKTSLHYPNKVGSLIINVIWAKK